MGGTTWGAKKAVQTNRQKDPDHYEKIGKIGGTKSNAGGFATYPGLAKEAGKHGGKVSRSGGSKAPHCRNGHPWNEANTRRHKSNGQRYCRACNKASSLRYRTSIRRYE